MNHYGDPQGMACPGMDGMDRWSTRDQHRARGTGERVERVDAALGMNTSCSHDVFWTTPGTDSLVPMLDILPWSETDVDHLQTLRRQVGCLFFRRISR